MISICMCWASLYDEHRYDCPYPLYACSLAEQDAWEAARDAKIKERVDARGGKLPEILKSAAVLEVLLAPDKEK